MQVNRYFDDQVLSLGFENSNGQSSVGVMAPRLTRRMAFAIGDHVRLISGRFGVGLAISRCAIIADRIG